jgi:hypothetical protein
MPNTPPLGPGWVTRADIDHVMDWAEGVNHDLHTSVMLMQLGMVDPKTTIPVGVADILICVKTLAALYNRVRILERDAGIPWTLTEPFPNLVNIFGDHSSPPDHPTDPDK